MKRRELLVQGVGLVAAATLPALPPFGRNPALRKPPIERYPRTIVPWHAWHLILRPVERYPWLTIEQYSFAYERQGLGVPGAIPEANDRVSFPWPGKWRVVETAYQPGRESILLAHEDWRSDLRRWIVDRPKGWRRAEALFVHNDRWKMPHSWHCYQLQDEGVPVLAGDLRFILQEREEMGLRRVSPTRYF